MVFLAVLFFIFSTAGDILGNNLVEISYDELVQLNASCSLKDRCQDLLLEGSGASPDGYSYLYSGISCSCGSHCHKVGTCCIDSPYRKYSLPAQMPRCRTIQYSSYFIMETCPRGNDSKFKHLCEDEWHGEDDLMKLVPVTSLHTSTTYKNYYCFRCHESTDKFLHWNVQLNGHYDDSGADLQIEDVVVTYNQTLKTWMTVIEKEGLSIPVELEYLVPDEILSLLIRCDPTTIGHCSDTWTDNVTRDKCNSYMAVVNLGIWGGQYKNPHCALCNWKSLSYVYCYIDEAVHVITKEIFSFTLLFRINARDSNADKCEENFMWDPFRKKCQKMSCPLEGYVFKDGECVHP